MNNLTPRWLQITGKKSLLLMLAFFVVFFAQPLRAMKKQEEKAIVSIDDSERLPGLFSGDQYEMGLLHRILIFLTPYEWFACAHVSKPFMQESFKFLSRNIERENGEYFKNVCKVATEQGGLGVIEVFVKDSEYLKKIDGQTAFEMIAISLMNKFKKIPRLLCLKQDFFCKITCEMHPQLFKKIGTHASDCLCSSKDFFASENISIKMLEVAVTTAYEERNNEGLLSLMSNPALLDRLINRDHEEGNVGVAGSSLSRAFSFVSKKLQKNWTFFLQCKSPEDLRKIFLQCVIHDFFGLMGVIIEEPVLWAEIDYDTVLSSLLWFVSKEKVEVINLLLEQKNFIAKLGWLKSEAYEYMIKTAFEYNKIGTLRCFLSHKDISNDRKCMRRTLDTILLHFAQERNQIMITSILKKIQELGIETELNEELMNKVRFVLNEWINLDFEQDRLICKLFEEIMLKFKVKSLTEQLRALVLKEEKKD